MRNRVCLAAFGIALLGTSLLVAPSARADWDDGFWYLDFPSHTTSGKDGDGRDLVGRDEVQAVILILLDGETGVVDVQADGGRSTMKVSAREAFALLDELEEAGYELVAVEETSEGMIGVIVIVH